MVLELKPVQQALALEPKPVQEVSQAEPEAPEEETIPQGHNLW
jgi:hypothetical protein